MAGLTDYHAKYLAHELTLRARSDSVEKLATALADAQVDLNPHQVDAALFAFNSPLSKGAILADEVGLGKTIEAGLLLSQKWAERKRRLLVIVPANLRKQWAEELADKFHLPSSILETRTFNEAIKRGNLNPFQQGAIVLCSYQFARTKEVYLKQTPWDLVVIDEAHRLRNVYKPTNKIANAIKEAVAAVPKVLLTATPLHGRLLDANECRRLLELPAAVAAPVTCDHVTQRLDESQTAAEKPILDELAARNGGWFDAEMEKLDRWADDRRQSLKSELDELDARLREMRKAARFAPSLPEKLERQRDVKRTEAKRDEAWRDFDRASREVDKRKDELLDEVGRRMLTYVERNQLFTIRFSIS